MVHKKDLPKFQTGAVDKSKNNKSVIQNEADTGQVWAQVLIILIGGLGAVNDGIIMAWSSPYSVQIVNDNVNYNITEEQASNFAIFPPIGMALSCIFFAKFTDVIGRKRTYLLITIPQVTFWLLTIFSTNVYVLWFARFLSGFSGACYFVSYPVYVAEISTPKVRGILGSAVTYFLFLGQFLSNVLGYFLNVKKIAYTCVGIPIIVLMLFAFVPESPYYLIIKGKDDEARKSLKTLTRKSDIDKDFAQLKSDVQRQMSEKGTWAELVTIKSNRRALIAASILRIAQQTSGIPVFVMSTQLLFEKAGGSIDSGVSSMIYTGLSFFVYMINGFFTDKLGRRAAEILSLSLCALISFLEAAYFYIDQKVPSIDLSNVSWIPLAGLLMYVVFSALGLAMVPTLMIGELFSASIKSKAFTIQIVLYGVSVSAVNYIFYFINSYTGLYGPFLFFGICNTFFSVLCYFVIPETRGKTLEEIQQDLKR